MNGKDNGGGKTISPAIKKQYKELIDFVYTLTFEKEYKDGFSGYNNNRLSSIVTELVKRGVLEKRSVYCGNKAGRYCVFTWKATSAPTDHFVNSVAHAIEGKRKEYLKSRREENMAQREKSETPEAPAVQQPSLSEFSSADLWAELKRRGAEIVNGKLMIVTYTTLD